jgi:hypothetical protein
VASGVTLHRWDKSGSNGGRIWQSDLANPTSTTGIEEILKTSRPTSTNPLTMLHLHSLSS